MDINKATSYRMDNSKDMAFVPEDVTSSKEDSVKSSSGTDATQTKQNLDLKVSTLPIIMSEFRGQRRVTS